MARLRHFAAALTVVLAAPAESGPVEQWRPLISLASARFGVPEEWIVRVMHAESRGRPDAVSRKGAMGLMQLMPGTWSDMRSELGLGPDPYDPHDNVVAGAAYLALLYDRFGYPGLFAAYNAGPQRYADQLVGRRALPLETRAYVAAVAGPLPRVLAVKPDAPKGIAQKPPAEARLFFALSASQLRQ